MGDVKAASNSSGGSIGSAGAVQLVPVGQRVRLKSFTLMSMTATYSFLNGSTSDGTNLFSVPIGAEDQNPFHVNIPGNGILFDNGIAVSMTSADANVLVDGISITYEG